MFSSGAAICLGLTVMFARCSWKTRMWMLSHALVMDIAVFVLLTMLHWGTYTGVMAATIGAVMVSLLITLAQKLWGTMENGVYKRGMWDIGKSMEAEAAHAALKKMKKAKPEATSSYRSK